MSAIRSKMSQTTINERIKFLIEALGMSARGFSTAIGASDTNTRNYLDRGSKPGADYIEKVLLRFETVNSKWLLTGLGEPFISPTSENHLVPGHNQKNFRSPVVGKNQDTATQQENISSTTELELVKNKLALAEKDIESLQTQLQMKDAVIAAKDETINLLRTSYNRSS